MFHAGRCGSTVIGMLLNQHPKINWIGEIFSRFKEKFGHSSWVWERPELMIKMRTNIHPCRVLGLEVKRGQMINLGMEEKKLINFLEKLGYKKYIILKRKNYLRKKISEIVSERIEKMNTKKDVKTPKVRVPIKMGKWDVPKKTEKIETIVDHFKMLDRFYVNLENILEKKEVIRIEYERDIKSNPKIASRKMLNMIGLKEHESKVETKKMNKKPLKDSISNFEEVKRSLSGTKYEWMIHEDY
jgi:hypothetical protein